MNEVKLLAVTMPLDEFKDMFRNSADIVGYCARVSNPSNQENFDTVEGLLKYCIRKQHWSIFEMVNIVMEINTTRDIGRQIIRHRTFTFQEFSQRYADPTKELGFQTREARLQDPKNRQNSIPCTDSNLDHDFRFFQQQVMTKAQEVYNWALAKGIAKEQARAVLPEGMVNSRMYMNGTLRSWIHYCQLRMANGTQFEHQLIATLAWGQLCKAYPFLVGMFDG